MVLTDYDDNGPSPSPKRGARPVSRAKSTSPRGKARQFESIYSVSARHAQKIYKRVKGNKRQACHELQVSYHTLVKYLRFIPEYDKKRP
jgi:transcriptional regulator with AAA-type ATPase domain